MGNKVDFLILGGGLTGLLLGQELQKRQRSFLIIEKSSQLGGRMGSEKIAGFTLDLGFQVSLSSYEWIQKWGDPLNLAWHEFDSGAYIHFNQSSYPIYNPLWHPRRSLASLNAIPQKTLLLKSLLPILWTSPQSVAHLSTLDFLKKLDIPALWIETFFRPFFGGVFLDRDLQTPASLFIYLFKKFALGKALYPQGGFQNLINKLATRISKEHILVDQQVIQINQSHVVTAQHQHYEFANLIQTYPEETKASDYQATHTFWYSAPKRSHHIAQPLLHLNGNPTESLTHACILSDIAPELAPKDFHLITASVTSPDHYFNYQENAIRQRVQSWFAIDQLQLLKIHSLPKALPRLNNMIRFNPAHYVKKSDHHFLIGDHWSIPSQQGVGQAVSAFIKNEVDW